MANPFYKNKPTKATNGYWDMFSLRIDKTKI